jgi:hypothetical protein
MSSRMRRFSTAFLKALNGVREGQALHTLLGISGISKANITSFCYGV